MLRYTIVDFFYKKILSVKEKNMLEKSMLYRSKTKGKKIDFKIAIQRKRGQQYWSVPLSNDDIGE